MNVILIAEGEITADSCVVLQDQRSEHIIKVLRSECGDKLRVGVIDGFLGYGQVLQITKRPPPGRVMLRVAVAEPPPAKSQIDLILGLPRPIMLKRILAQTASMGVSRIFLINANRVEKSFFSAQLLADDLHRQYLLNGLEQAVDTGVPEVSIHLRFRPFVEDALPIIKKEYACCLVAHPGAPLLHQVGQAASKGRVLLAVGPEGGWIDFEVEKFREQGFATVGLGARILRVDTAVVTLLAQLLFLREMQT